MRAEHSPRSHTSHMFCIHSHSQRGHSSRHLGGLSIPPWDVVHPQECGPSAPKCDLQRGLKLLVGFEFDCKRNNPWEQQPSRFKGMLWDGSNLRHPDACHPFPPAVVHHHPDQALLSRTAEVVDLLVVSTLLCNISLFSGLWNTAQGGDSLKADVNHSGRCYGLKWPIELIFFR